MQSILPYCLKSRWSWGFSSLHPLSFQDICLRYRRVFVTFLMSPPLHPSFTNMNCIWPGRCCRTVRHSSSLYHSLEYWFYFPSIRIKSEHHSWDWSHFFSLSARSRFHSKGQGDRLAAACLMHMDGRCSICSVAECKYTSFFPCSFSASDSDHGRLYMVSLVGHINAKLQ